MPGAAAKVLLQRCHHGVDALHEQRAQALQVAESGHGLAIGRRPMVDEHLARGTLIAPFGAGDPTGAAYYLCRPADASPTAATRRLERWLRALAASPGREPPAA